MGYRERFVDVTRLVLEPVPVALAAGCRRTAHGSCDIPPDIAYCGEQAGFRVRVEDDRYGHCRRNPLGC